MKKRLIAVMILIVLLLTACASRHSSAPTVDFYDNYDSAAGVPQSPAYSLADTGAEMSKALPMSYESDSAGIDRLVVHTADMTIEVLDTPQAVDAITKIAAQFDGFVVSSNIWQEKTYQTETLPYGTITIRVTAAHFEDAVKLIEQLVPDGEKNITSKVISGDDITSDYVDTKSKLTSLENTLKKLNEIMETAKTAKDTLMIYQEIADIETQIDQVKGQIQYMEQSAALSSISVRVQPIKPPKEIIPNEWSAKEVFNSAVQQLIDSAQVFGAWLITFAVSVLPFLLIIFIPLYFIIRAIVRKARRNAVASTAAKKENTEISDLK